MADGLPRSGLLERDLRLIREAAASLPEVRRLILFGSRAKGNHRPGSDVDLAIEGESAGYQTARQLAEILNEERPLPYFFDVVSYRTLTDHALIEHIDRVGVLLFDRDAGSPEERLRCSG